MEHILSISDKINMEADGSRANNKLARVEFQSWAWTMVEEQSEGDGVAGTTWAFKNADGDAFDPGENNNDDWPTYQIQTGDKFIYRLALYKEANRGGGYTLKDTRLGLVQETD